MSAVDYLEVIAEPSGATDNSRLQICAGPSDPNSARLPLPTRVFSKMSTKSCSTRNLKIAFAVILISFFIGTALLNYFLFKLKTLDLIETIETKNDELMRTINETETAQRLHQLENRDLIENAKKDFNHRLDAFAKSHKILTAKLVKVEKLADRHSQTLQRFLPHCSLARSAKL
ncbi:uncharacterized protein LOC132194029 [Neocloeon triangulifer]|uniref:uncharacterized protein LOC132194029 n=1 Tax=Neocloeon triangulifer TaxID=2078957 RepID=UPI00286F7CEC|nr:uncharacterized protein LOC132194029 [Neocloeon triangulifer]